MRLKMLLACVAACALSGCATVTKNGNTLFPETTSKAYIPDKTQTQTLLEALPAPDRPVAVAVYDFADQTGQFKPVDQGQTLSRAVSQGGASILVKALQDAGNRSWFTIVERESLKNLLNERQIIREMRERYLGEKGVNPQALPALLFAGVLLEGGIVGYDSNTVTGGVGAARPRARRGARCPSRARARGGDRRCASASPPFRRTGPRTRRRARRPGPCEEGPAGSEAGW